MMRRILTAAVLGSAAAVAGMTGCEATDPNDVSFDAVKSDLTPEMFTVTQTGQDVDRSMAVTGNQNLRLMWDDLGRAFLFDKPSTLAPYYTISTSPQP